MDVLDDDVELDVFNTDTIYEYEIKRGVIEEKESEIKVDKSVDELLTGEIRFKTSPRDAKASRS